MLVRKKLKLEDIAGSIYELDPLWSCREKQQQNAGKVQSESTSWRKRVCKNERGTEAGTVRMGGPIAKRSLGGGVWKMEQVVPEMSLKTWKESGYTEMELVYLGT